MSKTKVLVLFAKDWDLIEFARQRFSDRFEWVHAGFDLFRFPGNARLLAFDARRFVDALVRRMRSEGIAAVISNNEQFGALIAARAADAAGLPGNDPLAVATAHHKFYARRAMERIAPHSVPRYSVFPYTVSSADEVGLPFPCFVKPVKATFSVLARQVDDFATLARHLAFHPAERYLIKRLVRPFNDLTRDLPGFEIDAHHMVAEELIPGFQVNLDGYADRDGRAHVVGIVDEHMYPGTMAFSRFEYPSALPEAVQARIAALAQRVIQGLGYRQGFFNMELAWDPRTDALRIIEINPRLASQLAYLYECVDGVNLYEIALALALGESPRLARVPTRFARAASFAYRTFDGTPARPPSAEQVARMRALIPEARLATYFKRGRGLAREMRWLGSHRYAVLNLCGVDTEDLDRRYLDATRLLGFDRHGAVAPQRQREREQMRAPRAVPAVGSAA